MYVIWSFEHNGWWGPDRRGHYIRLELAGRYSPEEAGEIAVKSILLDALAIHEMIAEKQGPPTFHPYDGAKRD